jgi:dUTPase
MEDNFKWLNFLAYKTPNNNLYLWGIPKISKGGHQPRATHQKSFLLRAQVDITIQPHTQQIHATQLAMACPTAHYIEIQPWKQLTKTRQCLVAHGIYDGTYRGGLTMLIANPTSLPLNIKKGQVLARIQAVHQSMVGNITIIEGVDLGIETPAGVNLHTNVTIEEVDTEPLEAAEVAKIDYVIS